MLGLFVTSSLFLYVCKKKMKLIIDCGSTKADWVIIDGVNILKRFKTEGFNPNYTDKDTITKIILNESSYKEYVSSISKIYFYGSGCGNMDNRIKVKEILESLFVGSDVEVTHDMMAACRSVLGNESGVVCILGTGSNSCYYDGETITEQSVSLGYILGDEGSGSYIGKKLLRDYCYKIMPEDLCLKFENEYDVKLETVIRSTYHSAQVSKYFASFAKFAYDNIDNKYIYDLCSRCFDEFIDNFVTRYESVKKRDVGFVGSIAFYFQDIIKERLERRGFVLGKIVKEPIDGLIEFHCC